MNKIKILLVLAFGYLLGMAGVSIAQGTTTSPVYSVGIEYCNGKGQIDQYTTIRSGWQAWTNRVQHGDHHPGSYAHVVVQRRTAPNRDFYTIDHRDWKCPNVA
jgi:hypothetical protein